MSKAALIFVVYFDDHCQAQELNNDLPGCYGVETHILWKLGQVFMGEKGKASAVLPYKMQASRQ
jgi:hypothetical protein